MPFLAMALVSGMTIDRIIADEEDGLVGGNQGLNQATKLVGQRKGGPLGRGEGPWIGGEMILGQRYSGAEDVDDGASSGGEEGRSEEGHESMKSRSGKTGERA